MTEQVTLDPGRLKAAFAVLDREQAAYLPTERQNRLYRAFNISVYATIVAFAIALAIGGLIPHAAETPGTDVYWKVIKVLGWIGNILAVATLTLFISNWGLIRKLYRHARLRRELKLACYFEPAFRAQRKATRVGNAVTMTIALLGVVLVVGSLAFSIASFAIWLSTSVSAADFSNITIHLLSRSLPVLGVGLSFASLHFVRRGKQRLEVVLRLQETLQRKAADPSQTPEIKLSLDDYDAIASLEREHIIRDRASSIVSGRKESNAPGYLCQTSRQMYGAKRKLQPEVLGKVEGAIADLLANPVPVNATTDPVTGSRSIAVADTDLSIEYDVDSDRRLLRLYDLKGGTA